MVLGSCSRRPIVAPIRVRMRSTRLSHGFARALAAGLALRRVVRPQGVRNGSEERTPPRAADVRQRLEMIMTRMPSPAEAAANACLLGHEI